MALVALATLRQASLRHRSLVIHEVAADAQSHSLDHCNGGETGRGQLYPAAPVVVVVVDHLNPFGVVYGGPSATGRGTSTYVNPQF